MTAVLDYGMKTNCLAAIFPFPLVKEEQLSDTREKIYFVQIIDKDQCD